MCGKILDTGDCYSAGQVVQTTIVPAYLSTLPTVGLRRALATWNTTKINRRKPDASEEESGRDYECRASC